MLSASLSFRAFAAITAMSGTLICLAIEGASAAGRCALSEPCVFSLWAPNLGSPVSADDDEIAATSGWPCTDAPAHVRGVGVDRQMVCSGIKRTVEMLGRCNIHPRMTLHVEILDEVHGADGGTIFGSYDSSRDTILLTRSANLAPLVADTPYAALPPDDFIRSAIVHETVHAIMNQNALAPANTRSAQEYPAYALQIASMPASTRATFINQFDLSDPRVAADVFSDAILMFDPYYFAARAYSHYNSAAGGCASLGALLAGRAAFIAPQ